MTSVRNYLLTKPSWQPVLILPSSSTHSHRRGRKAKERPVPSTSDPAAEGRAGSLAKLTRTAQNRTSEPKIAPQPRLGCLVLPLAALGALLGEVSAPAHQQGLPQAFTHGRGGQRTATSTRSHLSPRLSGKAEKPPHGAFWVHPGLY